MRGIGIANPSHTLGKHATIYSLLEKNDISGKFNGASRLRFLISYLAYVSHMAFVPPRSLFDVITVNQRAPLTDSRPVSLVTYSPPSSLEALASGSTIYHNMKRVGLGTNSWAD